MKKNTFRILTLALALTLSLSALTGCGGTPSESVAPGDTSTATPEGEKKEDIVICMADDLETLDPIASSATATMAVTKMVYTSLYVQDDNKQPVPRLATSMENVSDTEIIFHLQEGAKFSDGSLITVEDVVFSLQRALKSPMFATLMKGVVSFEVASETSVRATTTGPSPAILLALSHPGTSILPKAYIEQAEASKDWSTPICSGQYTVKSREIGDTVVLQKNDNYFDAESAALNNTLTFKFVPEASSRTIMVETGEADLNFSFATADYNNVIENKELLLHGKTGNVVMYLGFDTTLEPFNNPQVRQAINYAVDREGVLAVVAEGLGVPAYSVLPPSTLGYVENPSAYEYNAEKAKELMTAAGYADGFTTDMIAFNDAGVRTAEVLQPLLAEIGITINIKRFESSVRMDMIANHQAPTFVGQWGAMSDAEMVLPRLFTEEAIGGMNFTHYSNKDLEPLFQEARSTYDTDVRKKLYEETVTIIAEDAPWCPLYIGTNFALARAGLEGVVLDGESLIDLNLLHY